MSNEKLSGPELFDAAFDAVGCIRLNNMQWQVEDRWLFVQVMLDHLRKKGTVEITQYVGEKGPTSVDLIHRPGDRHDIYDMQAEEDLPTALAQLILHLRLMETGS